MSLELIDISKKFPDKTLFNSLNLSFPEKGIYAIVGESGSGKTTLLRMICGLDKDFGGKVEGGGIKNCSFAFQEYRLFPYLSALDNLVLAVKDEKDPKTRQKAISILKFLGFSEEEMNKLPKELSGGMKQRVSIGRALMKDSPILLLDEPTKELDEENISLVLEAVKKESEKRLVLIVTHRIEDVHRLSASIIDLDELK